MRTNLTFGDQVPIFLAFAAIGAEHPDLPRVYVTTPANHDLSIQAPTAGDFEAWRSALDLPTGDVELVSFEGSKWLSVCGVWRGLSVEVTGHDVNLPAEKPEPSTDAAGGAA